MFARKNQASSGMILLELQVAPPDKMARRDDLRLPMPLLHEPLCHRFHDS
jgi:hypothetical protein